MELERLHAFQLVAQMQNISKAAELLYISQPSLSQTIRRLEEDWGTPLFEREGKHVRLNRCGEILLEASRQIDAVLQQAYLAMEEEKHHPPEISIYIGCASMLLPELLCVLKECVSQARYQIFQWDGGQPQQEVDLCIVAEPGRPEEVTEQLLEEQIGVAVPTGHPLALKEQIFLNDLCEEEFVSLNETWHLYQETMQVLEKAKFVPKTIARVDNPNLLRELLKVGMGLAFVPMITWHAFAGDQIVIRPIADCSMYRRIYLVHRHNEPISRTMTSCIDGIHGFFDQMTKKPQ